MVDACARVGDAARAEFWVTEMVRMGEEPGAACYGVLLSAFAKLGDVQRAEKWFGRMQQDSQSDVSILTYNSLINACAKAYDLPAGVRWLQRMLDAGVEADVVSHST